MKLWREKRTWIAKHALAKLARLSPESVRSIAVIKHAAYGDLLCTRPFLVTLRKYFPHARLTFSAINHYRRGIPEDLVDRVHLIPGIHDRQRLFGSWRAMKELGYHQLLFDLTESTPSMLLSWLTPADFKIGFQHRSLHKWVYDAAILRAEYRFEAETFLEQLHILGMQYDLPLDYAYPATALQRGKPYVVYFPTASAANKSWPVAHFIDLIGQMAAQYAQYEHIILSGLADWEIQRAEQAAHALAQHANVVKLAAGPDDANLLKGASALVANDTGIRHLGIAVGVPTVGIFFHAPPFGYWPRFGRHEVSYELDGSIPPAAHVAQALRRILDAD